jgi:hypothetical protein
MHSSLILSDAPIAFSRRRSRPRPSNQSLPDWVWGAGLGVIVVFFVGGFFVISNTTGGGGATCDNALAPLPGGNPPSAQQFIEEDAALARVVNALNSGDRAAAEQLFYGDVHAFTHNIEPAVREADTETGVALCEAVIKVEDTFSQQTPPTVAVNVQELRAALTDAAEALGYPRPD